MLSSPNIAVLPSRRLLRIPATLMRGGTSKCVIFHAEDLAGHDIALDDILLSAFGSVDPSQVDGVGGATSTTSKAAVVSPSSRPGVDVEFLFAQVGIGNQVVEYGSNCGNCATAVGLHAIQTGLVAPRAGTTVVRMLNLNTGTLLTAAVATEHGAIPECGDALVPGSLSRTGVPVALGFVDPVGRTSGRLLPSGRAVDVVGALEATLVDAGAPAMFIDARGFGAGTVEGIREASSELISLRRQGAVRMGLVPPGAPVPDAIPKVGLVAPPTAYTTTSGRRVGADEHDVSVRMMSMFAPHPAIGLTSAVALAAAAVTAGTVPNRIVGGGVAPTIRLGTAAGVVELGTRVDGAGVLREVVFQRVARRIATMELFVPCGGG
ncbi:PrpF domain-containing protein [Saccharothrix longispora]|uniref:2-methylaconitate cis-trans-isomerase PrpF n=1 Tax=Saccharothrix longispora TaxID=33920 RepID=A0ABU1PS21_9PSEU|nr:PrpF domain-containing protein [Saccharothrix longispora]MDR6593438.1 2-methylaconitate cis-trans-isomerase PrpF [Saccharothrix longispora]